MDAESKIQRNQVEVAKSTAEMQIKVKETELKQQELMLKADIERMKAELTSLQRETDTDQKVASLELEMNKQDTQQRLEELEIQLKAVNAERDQEIELYKTQMNNLTKLVTEEIKHEGDDGETARLRQMVEQLTADNERLTQTIEGVDGTEG